MLHKPTKDEIATDLIWANSVRLMSDYQRSNLICYLMGAMKGNIQFNNAILTWIGKDKRNEPTRVQKE